MKTLPRISWKAYSIEKHGNKPDENEDAYCATNQPPFMSGLGQWSCAVADGATQTSFARIWAKLLVEQAAVEYPDGNLGRLLTTAQTAWKERISNIPLPWHAEEKVRQGAFATLLWFGLLPSGKMTKAGGSWNALAVGDSCLFQLRKNEVVEMYPRMIDFNNSPTLLSSSPARNIRILDHLENSRQTGSWQPGDDFLLMTDAAAAWFLREQQTVSPEVLRRSLLEHTRTADSYRQWIDELRRAGEMKNDDTTIVWIRM